MADINSPREFLQEALSLVDTLNADKAQLQQETNTRTQLDNSLDSLRKTIEQDKNKTIASRRSDLEAEYNKKLKNAENEIAAIENRRSRARQEGVNDRITNQTAGLKGEIANLKAQLDTYCKENKLSMFCKSPLYHKLFMPAKPGDWVLLLIIVFLMIGALVAAFFLLHKQMITLPTAIIIALVDVALALLYAVIAGGTRGKHPNEVRVCRQYIDQIAQDKKGIRNVTKNIQKDKDDTPYDLGSFDVELQAKTQEKADLEMQKSQALYQFDAVTKQQLISEIDASYAAKLEDLTKNTVAARAAAEQTAQKVTYSENLLNAEFVQYLGSRNLNHDALDRMISLIDAGEAASVTDAVTKLGAKK